MEKLDTSDIPKINDHLLKAIKAFSDNVPKGSELMNEVNNIEAYVKTCLT